MCKKSPRVVLSERVSLNPNVIVKVTDHDDLALSKNDIDECSVEKMLGAIIETLGSKTDISDSEKEKYAKNELLIIMILNWS